MWEVLIGAVAALAGGFGGAMLQARSSKQILAEQLADAAQVRRETYEREDRSRFLDLRRKAYGELLTRWDELKIAEEVAMESRLRLRRVDDQFADGDEITDEALDAKSRFLDDLQDVTRLRAIVDEATAAVRLLAPAHIVANMPDHKADDFESGRMQFLRAARDDLGVGDQVAVEPSNGSN